MTREESLEWLVNVFNAVLPVHNAEVVRDEAESFYKKRQKEPKNRMIKNILRTWPIIFLSIPLLLLVLAIILFFTAVKNNPSHADASAEQTISIITEHLKNITHPLIVLPIIIFALLVWIGIGIYQQVQKNKARESRVAEAYQKYQIADENYTYALQDPTYQKYRVQFPAEYYNIYDIDWIHTRIRTQVANDFHEAVEQLKEEKFHEDMLRAMGRSATAAEDYARATENQTLTIQEAADRQREQAITSQQAADNLASELEKARQAQENSTI